MGQRRKKGDYLYELFCEILYFCFVLLFWCVCLWCTDGPYITSSLQCFPVSHLHVITALFYK